MKKIFLFTILIFLTIGVFSYTQLIKKNKVFQINSPFEIYVDENRNLIFEEENPIKIEQLYYINRNTNIESFPIFENLTEDEKFLLEYFAIDYSKKLLKNKFITLKDDKIFIKNKEYSQLLLDSNFYFNDNKETQEKLVKYIKSINTDDYVLYNPKTKYYHKLNCKEAQTNSILVKKAKLVKNSKPCKLCFNKKHEETKTKINKSFEFENIKIIFFDLNNVFKPNNKCTTIGCTTLKEEINNAKETIDFAIYGINNQPEIINALINAYKRGVKIRWVCDYDKKLNNYYPDTLKLQEELPNFTSDKEYEYNNPSAIMHNKFFIFDNKKVWTASANITSTDLSEFNANYAVLINSKEIAQIYKHEFEQMYKGYFHKDKIKRTKNIVNLSNTTKIKVLFSPQDNIISNEIIPLIDSAKKYIYISIFFITHKEIQQSLINAHKRGVEIKIINDATNAHSKHTIHKALRTAGIKVKTENYAGKMHSKTMIIDNEISVIGSLNYTKNGNNKNDENVVVIYNEEIAKYMQSTFMYLWNKIPEKYEIIDPSAESLESIGSCFDGIDNDFDNKIDNKDSGCFIKNN